jgi:hypothetical protein
MESVQVITPSVGLIVWSILSVAAFVWIVQFVLRWARHYGEPRQR